MQFLYDLRYSLRLLRKTPGFTAITLVVLVSGLSLFLVAYAMGIQFNKSPEFPNGDRYVSLKSIDELTNFADGIGNHDHYSFNLLAASSENYALLGAFSESEVTLSDGEISQRYLAASITPELLSVTTVNPLLGRSITSEELTASATDSVLISHRVWQNYYSGDENIIGRISRIGGQPYSIVGVMPDGFHFPHQQDLWMPLAESTAAIPGEGTPLSVVGILQSASDFAAADAEIKAVRTRLVAEFPEIYPPRQDFVAPFAMINQPSNSRLTDLDFIVMSVTMFIVALTVINLSSLLFMRSSTRNQELALRSAVGGSGLHLARQVLLESFIICVGGLVLSIAVAGLLLRILKAEYVSFGSTYMSQGLHLSMQVVFAGCVAMLLIWLISGLHVAFKAYKSQPGSALASSGKGSNRQQGGRAFTTTVFLEVILSCFLLILCGFMVGFINDFREFDFGVKIEDTIVGNVILNSANYASPEQRLSYLQNLEQELSEIGGVDAIGFTSQLPGLPGWSGTYSIEDRDLEVQEQLPPQASIWVSDNYFDIAQVSILEGREFNSADSADSENVVIITGVLAEQLWPGGTAIGKRIQSVINQQQRFLRVVGVITSIQQFPFEFGTPVETLYRPLTQYIGDNFFIYGRHQSSVSADDLRQAFLAAATAADRDIPLENVRSLEAEVSLFMGDVPVTGMIFQAFAIATLVVASIGIYGVIARSIFIRTHEIGVRRALGSSNFRIIGRFIRQGSNYLLVGILIGVLPAAIIISFISSTVDYGGEIDMPVISTLVIVVLGLIIAVASYFPARRAVAMEPGDALRYE